MPALPSSRCWREANNGRRRTEKFHDNAARALPDALVADTFRRATKTRDLAMKAVVIHEHGGIEKLRYEDVETPVPGQSQVLVRVRAAGVNHFDQDIREGVSGVTHPLPHVPGVEGVGEVAALGEGATGVEIGDRVAINFFQSCGTCRMCMSGLDGICLEGQRMGVTVWGSYAEFALSDATNLVPLPESLSYEDAAASLICLSTAWHMAVTLGRVKAGEDVLVNAAGSGVGSSAIQVAKLHGATVLASAGSRGKLEKARRLGADHVIDYTTQNLRDEAVRLTGGKGPDLVIESVGGAVLAQSIEALCRNGRLITCGAHAGERVEIDVIELFRKHISVHGSHYASKIEVAHVLGLVAAGRLTPQIETRFPLAEAQKAAALIASRSVFGKLMLIP